MEIEWKAYGRGLKNKGVQEGKREKTQDVVVEKLKVKEGFMNLERKVILWSSERENRKEEVLKRVFISEVERKYGGVI